MAKDFAIEIRDKLNKMAEELFDSGGGDMETEVSACCIAMAVEELEKWIYNGEWMPSVTPIKVERKWFKMPKGKEDDEEWEGPPWNRKPKEKPSIEDRLPTLAKLKKKREDAKKKNSKPMGDLEIDLDTRTLADWTSYEKSVLAEGDRSKLIRAIVSSTRCSVKRARAYIDRLENEGVIERD